MSGFYNMADEDLKSQISYEISEVLEDYADCELIKNESTTENKILKTVHQTAEVAKDIIRMIRLLQVVPKNLPDFQVNLPEQQETLLNTLEKIQTINTFIQVVMQQNSEILSKSSEKGQKKAKITDFIHESQNIYKISIENFSDQVLNSLQIFCKSDFTALPICKVPEIPAFSKFSFVIKIPIETIMNKIKKVENSFSTTVICLQEEEKVLDKFYFFPVELKEIPVAELNYSQLSVINNTDLSLDCTIICETSKKEVLKAFLDPGQQISEYVERSENEAIYVLWEGKCVSNRV